MEEDINKRLIWKGHKPLQLSSGGSYFVNVPKKKIVDAGLQKGIKVYLELYHALPKKRINFD